MNAIISKLSSMTSGEILAIAQDLKDKTDDASDMVFTAALDVLESKLDEIKYMEVLETLS